MIAKTTKPRQNPWDHESNTPWRDYLPVHWGIRRLRTVVEMRVSNVDKHTNDDEIPVRLCNYVDVYYNDQIDGNLPYMKATVSPAEADRFRLKQNDVIITKDSEEWNDIAVPALVADAPNDLVCGYHLAILRPSSAINGAYLARALQIPPIAHQFHVEAQGITRYGLTHDDILSASIPLPPLEEQAAIVRYIDYADELVSRYITVKERLIALLEEQHQAVIQQAVTRGYDPDVPLKPSHVTNVPLMPAHWEIKRLKSMSHIRYGLGQPPRESPNGLPLIRATNVSRGHITENAMMYVDPYDVPTTRDAFLRENEIIVVRSGAYTADSAIIPKRYEGAISGYDMVVAATEANPEFLAMALLSTYVRDDQLIVVSNRAAQPHLNAEELGDAKILTPPRPEQEAIVNYLHHRLTEVANAKERAHRQIDLMHEYRTSLIADVVTGQIDVRGAAVVVPEP